MAETDLNDAQAAAVAHVEGPLLVFAGAGSGKTRVITYRIANLLSSARVPPWRILAVTFTNKAATEMRARLERLCGAELAQSLWVGTFHAICAKLLRVHGAAIGIQSNFVIYDVADQKAVVARALKDLDLDERRYPPRTVLGAIHKHKQEGRGPDEAAAHSYIDDVALRIFRAYEERLRAANAVDFEDLILLVARLLEGPEGDKVRRRFDYVLVDEFQDTNATQYSFLKQLSLGHRNLCVVGDDDQSIYRWRGADVRNIRGFRRDYAEAKVVKLEQNYRSTGRIVAAALGVISRSYEREPKELWTANDAGEAVHIVAAKDERDEAAFVVSAIQQARAEGVDAREIAVFYRVHAQSRVLEEGLRAARIAYQIVGGIKFYDRAEIKVALSYLRVLVNPQSDVDVLRIANVPARGIGQTTLDRVVAWATANQASVFDALGKTDAIDDLGSPAKKRLVGLRSLLDGLRAAVAADPSPSQLLERVVSGTGYLAALEAEDNAEGDARVENLRELAGSVHDYEAEAAAAGESPSVSGFLERVTLATEGDGADDGGRVVLMTVHGAKGLEFERVVLTGMEEEMFPYKGLDPAERDELEEERRLAYVAITRARKQLFITHTQMRQIFGTTRWNRPSRFLAELPASVSEHVATRAMAAEARSSSRYVDREPPSRVSARDDDSAPARSLGAGRPWRHPQASSSPPPPDPGQRFVDHDFFDDRPHTEEATLRRGMRVAHDRFGEGEVRQVVSLGEPAVVAFFPGWGEKRILARFLKPAKTG